MRKPAPTRRYNPSCRFRLRRPQTNRPAPRASCPASILRRQRFGTNRGPEISSPAARDYTWPRRTRFSAWWHVADREIRTVLNRNRSVGVLVVPRSTQIKDPLLLEFAQVVERVFLRQYGTCIEEGHRDVKRIRRHKHLLPHCGQYVVHRHCLDLHAKLLCNIVVALGHGFIELGVGIGIEFRLDLLGIIRRLLDVIVHQHTHLGAAADDFVPLLVGIGRPIFSGRVVVFVRKPSPLTAGPALTAEEPLSSSSALQAASSTVSNTRSAEEQRRKGSLTHLTASHYNSGTDISAIQAWIRLPFISPSSIFQRRWQARASKRKARPADYIHRSNRCPSNGKPPSPPRRPPVPQHLGYCNPTRGSFPLRTIRCSRHHIWAWKKSTPCGYSRYIAPPCTFRIWEGMSAHAPWPSRPRFRKRQIFSGNVPMKSLTLDNIYRIPRLVKNVVAVKPRKKSLLEQQLHRQPLFSQA